jgi:hypothetical protein
MTLPIADNLGTTVGLLQQLVVSSLTHSGGAARETPRNNHSVAILLCPLVRNALAVDHCVPAVTVDLSESGLGVITRHPLECETIGIVLQRPAESHAVAPDYSMATGRIRHNTSIGGGFWHVGVQLLDILSNQSSIANQKQLRQLASHILPPTNY